VDRYILNANGDPEPCGSLIEWGRWMERDGNDDLRRVALDEVGAVKVSTVFLGLDHSFGGAVPVLFETIVFGGEHDGYQDRYTTRDEALTGHAKAMAMVMNSTPDREHAD
jgi:hypothetical protein